MTAHVYVPNPPVAVTVASKGTLTSPRARLATNGSPAETTSGLRTTIWRAFGVGARVRVDLGVDGEGESSGCRRRSGDEAGRGVDRKARGKRAESDRPRLGVGKVAVIWKEYAVPTVPTTADSGPIVSLGMSRVHDKRELLLRLVPATVRRIVRRLAHLDVELELARLGWRSTQGPARRHGQAGVFPEMIANVCFPWYCSRTPRARGT